jgi:hypothetical protein
VIEHLLCNYEGLSSKLSPTKKKKKGYHKAPVSQDEKSSGDFLHNNVNTHDTMELFRCHISCNVQNFVKMCIYYA